MDGREFGAGQGRWLFVPEGASLACPLQSNNGAEPGDILVPRVVLGV